MKSSMQVNNPETIELSMTITMPLEHWTRLAKQLGELPSDHWISYPVSDLRSKIQELSKKANVHFKPDEELETEEE